MRLIATILILVIRVYRMTLSPLKFYLFGPQGRCRYTPTCSLYAIEALQQHGPAKGAWLATRRICRCHPWGGCGDDPVPSGSAATQRDGGEVSIQSEHCPAASGIAN